MTSLCLKPNGPAHFDLVIRDHGPAETNYYLIKTVTDEVAEEIMRAGAPQWLYGVPDWEKRAIQQKIACAEKQKAEGERMAAEAAKELAALTQKDAAP
jgi:hypothetical protein